MPSIETLGNRLTSILTLVADVQQQRRYDKVWDCCCDHGYLGIEMLRANVGGELVFVDQIPHIMQVLERRLVEFSNERYSVITSDAGSLTFAENQQHLIVLAGVGGTTTVDIINSICAKNRGGNIDFIVCPTKSLFDVRECLVEYNFSLAREFLVMENNRSYEVIYVTSRKMDEAHSELSLVGAMWDKQNIEHQCYLLKLVAHYQRESQGKGRERSKRILQHYLSLLAK